MRASGRRVLLLAPLLALCAAAVFFPRRAAQPARPSAPVPEAIPPTGPGEPEPAGGGKVAPPPDAAPVAPAPPLDEPTAPEEAPANCRGLLLRMDGRPLADPTVFLVAMGEDGEWRRIAGRVEADGSFLVAGVPEGLLLSSVAIEAAAAGFPAHTFTFPAADAASGRIRIVLRPPVRIRGRVVDEAGRPVAGCLLWAFSGPFSSFTATTGPDGRFVYVAPPEWIGPVHVDPPGGRMDRILLPEISEGDEDIGDATGPVHADSPGAPPDRILLPAISEGEGDIGDIVIASGRPIDGQILDARGDPVAGFEIALYSSERRGDRPETALTDDEGRFRFDSVGRGIHEVAGEGPAGGAQATGLRAGETGVVLRLRPVCALTIRLLHATTGEPLSVARSETITRRNGAPPEQESFRVHQGPHGEVRVWVTEPGTYEVSLGSAFHEGVVLRDVPLTPEEPAVREVRLKPAGSR